MSEVTRDFDAERQERYPEPVTFRLRGEVFEVLLGITPEEYAEKASPYFAMTTQTSNEDAIAIADQFISSFLADEDGDTRWQRVRARRNPAVTARELFDICRWIIEEQTGVPTQLPPPSSNGDESAGETSTESSSSEVADLEASAA